MIKYEITYNEKQEKFVLYKIDDVNFNIKGIFKANTRKECQEWLKQYRKGLK